MLVVPSTGDNGYYNLQVDMDGVKEVVVVLSGSGAVTHINYRICDSSVQPSVGPSPVPSSKPSSSPRPSAIVPSGLPSSAPSTSPSATPTLCPYISLDFEGLPRGDYVTNQLLGSHSVVISAVGGNGQYTPGGAARVFDTNVTGGSDGDPDLGSPNAGCGGPGVGTGGAPGSSFENCAALGNPSTRRISDEVGIPKTTVKRVLRKKLNLFPYKLHCGQTLM